MELSVKDNKSLVSEIKDSYSRARDGWQSAIEQSISCGGKLSYAKSQLQHGQWIPFLTACEIPINTANELMRMHNHRDLLREKSARTWRDAKRIVKEAKRSNCGHTHNLGIADSDCVDPIANESKVQMVSTVPICIDEPVPKVTAKREDAAEDARTTAIWEAVRLFRSLNGAELETFFDVSMRLGCEGNLIEISEFVKSQFSDDDETETDCVWRDAFDEVNLRYNQMIDHINRGGQFRPSPVAS